MTLSTIVRRTHMFLALFFFPWILMYALSTVVMNHRAFFVSRCGEGPVPFVTERRLVYDGVFPENAQLRTISKQILTSVGLDGAHAVSRRQGLDAAAGLPLWTLRAERIVDVPVPEDTAGLKAFGRTLLTEAGIDSSSYGTYRQTPSQINVYSYSFWKSTQLKYYVDQTKLTIEDRRFRWDHFLTGMHARGGFDHQGALALSWSVVVDVVVVAMIVWVASGLYMWWELPGQRRWGWLAIMAGAVSFLAFALRL